MIILKSYVQPHILFKRDRYVIWKRIVLLALMAHACSRTCRNRPAGPWSVAGSRWRQRQLDGTKTRGIACKKVIASSQYLESRGKSGVKQKNWLRAGPCEPTGRGKMARRNNGHIFARGKPDRDPQNRDDDGEISYVRRSSQRRALFNKWRDMTCQRWCLHGLSRLPCGPIL